MGFNIDRALNLKLSIADHAAIDHGMGIAGVPGTAEIIPTTGNWGIRQLSMSADVILGPSDAVFQELTPDQNRNVTFSAVGSDRPFFYIVHTGTNVSHKIFISQFIGGPCLAVLSPGEAVRAMPLGGRWMAIKGESTLGLRNTVSPMTFVGAQTTTGQGFLYANGYTAGILGGSAFQGEQVSFGGGNILSAMVTSNLAAASTFEVYLDGIATGNTFTTSGLSTSELVTLSGPVGVSGAQRISVRKNDNANFGTLVTVTLHLEEQMAAIPFGVIESGSPAYMRVNQNLVGSGTQPGPTPISAIVVPTPIQVGIVSYSKNASTTANLELYKNTSLQETVAINGSSGVATFTGSTFYDPGDLLSVNDTNSTSIATVGAWVGVSWPGQIFSFGGNPTAGQPIGPLADPTDTNPSGPFLLHPVIRRTKLKFFTWHCTTGVGKTFTIYAWTNKGLGFERSIVNSITATNNSGFVDLGDFEVSDGTLLSVESVTGGVGNSNFQIWAGA